MTFMPFAVAEALLTGNVDVASEQVCGPALKSSSHER
jgi:hypothetical protein